MGKLIELSSELAGDIESSRSFRGQAYKSLSDQNPNIKNLSTLSNRLELCIDDKYRYSEALDIIDHLKDLHKDHPDLPAIQALNQKVAKQREYILANLQNELDSLQDCPLQELSGIVQLLIRCGNFTRRKIQLRFLQARDRWFNDECESKSESFDQLTTFFCHGLPKIYNEFKSIFGDSEAQAINKFTAISNDKDQDGGPIINSWLLLKTTTFVLSLDMHLKTLTQSRLLTPSMLGDTMEKCFKLTNWLSSIGFDFSSQLVPLFSKSITSEVKYSMDRSTVRFETEFTKIVSKSIGSLLLPVDDEILRISNMRTEEKTPPSLEHYPVFKIYCLYMIDSMRWVRAASAHISPISLCQDVYSAINASLSRVVQTLTVILNTDDNAKNPILSKISTLFLTEIVPFLSRYCELLFPEKIILNALGLTTREFKNLCDNEPDQVKNLHFDQKIFERLRQHLGMQSIRGNK